MKYLWLNQNGKRVNVSTEIGGFIEKEKRIKMMDNYDYNQLYDSSQKSKRLRIAFTTRQINYLENQFKKSAYIGAAERKEVAATLNIPEKAIKIWFQNRRMREKKESTTKEVDDEQGIREYLDFTKLQSNNVNVLSVNEQPTSSLSLPLLTDLMQGNYYNTEGTKCSACKARQAVQRNQNKDSAVQIYADNLLSMTTAKAIHPPSAFVKTSNSSPKFKTTAEFSIDLWKKYKTESSTKLFHEEQQFFKTESENVKKMEESKPVGFTQQIMPDNTLLSITTAKAAHQPSAFVKRSHSSPNFKTTAEFSIDLWKKYKNKSSTKSFYEEHQSFKIESENKKKLEESKTVGLTEQIMPEDLSPRRKRNVAVISPQQPVPGNASRNSGFVSLVPTVPSVYTQPYISTRGVSLKPGSAMPVVDSNSSAVAVPYNQLLKVSPVQDYYAKKSCNCDCQCTRKQVVPQIQDNIPQRSPSPEYIITLPFQNPTRKF